MSKFFEALQKAENEKKTFSTERPNKDGKESLINFNLDVRITEELKNMKLYIRSISDQKTIRTILFTSSATSKGFCITECTPNLVLFLSQH